MDAAIDFTGKLCSRVLGESKKEILRGKDRLGVLTCRGPLYAGSDSPGARRSIIKPFASLFRHGSVVVVQADNRSITGPKERAARLGTIGARSLD